MRSSWLALPRLCAFAAAFVALAAAGSLRAADGPRLANGSMTAGENLPDAWTQKWEGDGKLAASRDTTTFKQGPASLRIDTVDGPARGQISQILDAKPGETVRFAGYVKTQGQATATVGVISYTAAWAALHFQTFQRAKGEQDWLPFAGEAKLPDGTVRCAFAVFVEGQGSVWLDECTSEAEPFAAIAKTAKNAAPPAGPPKAPNSWTAGEGFWPDYPAAWRQTHEGMKSRAKQGTDEVVFLGDSITQGWGDSGKQVWAEYYAPRKAVNFGIGGDGTPQILWRLEHGALDGLKPKLVVLMIGTNNRWRGDATAESLAQGIDACVRSIRERAPTAKVLVLGIFPTQESPDHADRKLYAEANQRVAKLADDRTVFFLDLTSTFLEPDGRIARETMPDFLHLTEKAYRAWATAMEPTVKKLLGVK